jgi:hypothetical protein
MERMRRLLANLFEPRRFREAPKTKPATANSFLFQLDLDLEFGADGFEQIRTSMLNSLRIGSGLLGLSFRSKFLDYLPLSLPVHRAL